MSNDDEIERLRQDVRALRDEIAGRAVIPVRSSGSRGLLIACGVCAVAIGGTMLAASTTIRLPDPGRWTVVAEQVSARAAVGIVERIFTVY